MATRSAPDGGRDDDRDDPVDSPDDYEYERVRADDVWTHRETGLTVAVRKNARPDQMHTPETSTRMEGFKAEVRGGPENVAEPIATNDLGHRGPQQQNALEFMNAFPDGEYVPEIQTGWDFGRVRWRDVVDEREEDDADDGGR